MLACRKSKMRIDTITVKQTIPVESTIRTADSRLHPVKLSEVLRVVKGRRTVFDGQLNGEPAIIKRFEDFFAWYRCGREERGLNKLAQRGLVAPRVLMRGKDANGCSILVIEKIQDAANALTLINTAPPETAEKTFIDIFRCVARMHEAGIIQNDLHLGNFLAAGTDIYAIDPACMRFKSRPIGMGKTMSQLAMLVAGLPGQFTNFQRQCFEAYCNMRKIKCSKKFAETVLVMADRRHEKMLPRILAKTLRDGTRFFTIKQPGLKAHFYREAFDNETARMLAKDIEIITSSGAMVDASEFCRTTRCNWNGKPYLVKSYPAQGGLRSVLSIFKPCPARREWLKLWKAVYNHEKTIPPAALITKRVTKTCCLIFEQDSH